jgi:hypothetical protein
MYFLFNLFQEDLFHQKIILTKKYICKKGEKKEKKEKRKRKTDFFENDYA